MLNLIWALINKKSSITPMLLFSKQCFTWNKKQAQKRKPPRCLTDKLKNQAKNHAHFRNKICVAILLARALIPSFIPLFISLLFHYYFIIILLLFHFSSHRSSCCLYDRLYDRLLSPPIWFEFSANFGFIFPKSNFLAVFDVHLARVAGFFAFHVLQARNKGD